MKLLVAVAITVIMVVVGLPIYLIYRRQRMKTVLKESELAQSAFMLGKYDEALLHLSGALYLDIGSMDEVKMQLAIIKMLNLCLEKKDKDPKPITEEIQFCLAKIKTHTVNETYTDEEIDRLKTKVIELAKGLKAGDSLDVAYDRALNTPYGE